jgi:hypothetical protein
VPESNFVQVEQKSVALADLKAGVPLLAGNPVLLIVSDAEGSRKLGPTGAPEATEPEDGPQTATPSQDRVKNPRWGTPSAGEVEMVADAPEGATVLFTVERRAGAGARWQSLGSVKAAAQGGTARAKTLLQNERDLDTAHFRFRAALLFGK